MYKFIYILIDFQEERKLFNKHIIPEIQEYCLRNNIDVEVIDLHLGVVDKQFSTADWQTFIGKEIERCKLQSYGPCFVVSL